MAYNPFDDIIDQDPAYMAEGGGTGTTDQTVTKTAYNQFGQPIMEYESDPRGLEKFTRDMYGLVLGEEDPYANKKLERELSVALAQKEAGLPVDPNKSFVTSAERQDPVLGPALDKFKFEPMGLGEFGERALEFLYRDQEKARSKKLRGEELTLGEKIAANPFMAALDAADFAGLIGLATKGGIKLSAKGLKTLDNLRSQGASKEVINQIMTTQFPDDAQKIGLVYYQTNRPPGMETSQIMKAPDMEGQSIYSKSKEVRDRTQKRFESLYAEPLQDYLSTTKSPSSAGFLSFLESKKIPIDITSQTREAKRRHIKTVMDYLMKDEFVSGPYRPWMEKAEEILKASDKKLGVEELKQKLKNENFDVQTFVIQGWGSKGANVQDKNVLKNLDLRGSLDINAEQQKSAILDLIEDLKQNPEKQGKGLRAYNLEIPYQDRKINLKNFFRPIEQGKRDLNKLGITQDQLDELKELVKKQPTGKQNLLFQYIPFTQKKINDEFSVGVKKIEETFRSSPIGQKVNFEKIMDAYNIKKVNDPLYDKDLNNKAVQNLINDVTALDSPQEIAAYQKIFNNSIELSDYTNKKWRQTVMNNPALQETLLNEYKKLYPNIDLEKAINYGSRAFQGHLSHIYKISDFAGKDKTFKKGMIGTGYVPNFVRTNFGFENIALQTQAENVMDKAVKDLRKNLTEGNFDNVRNILDKIKKYDDLLSKKGMAAYRRIDKESLTPEVIDLINYKLGKNASGTIKKAGMEDEVSGKFNDFLIGSERPQTLENQKQRFDELMNYFINNPESLKVSMKNPKKNQPEVEGFLETPYIKKGFLDLTTKELRDNTSFKKGGPVHMALGGDPLENLNQQQFTPDPAIDDDFFAKAVQDENLYAFNPMNLFKSFKKVPAMFTPDKNKTLMDITPDATTGLPVVQRTELNDFPFQSHFIQTLSEKGIPNADTTKGWKNLFTGTKGFSQSELKDAGIFDYLEDADKFIPGAKITKEDLLRVYENSPIANIEIKVKDKSPLPDTLPISGEYKEYMGGPKHEGMGSAQIDEGGTDYRNIIINVKKLPGEKKPFFNASHYEKDPNVLAFTRVANYKNANGQDVAVIQELQTDLLTNLKKEQERLAATMKIVRRQKNALKEQIQNYPASADYYQQELDKLEMQYPESKIKFLEETNLVRPTDPVFAEKLAPELTKDLNDIQDQINNLTKANLKEVVDPDYVNKIVALQNEGREKFNRLYELNRQANYDLMLENVDVIDQRTSDEILRAGENQTYVPRNNPVQTFPNIPFNKGPDWIDMMLKATIQDAQNRGINKVAIMPSDIVNMRWNKDPDSQAGEKFKTIYDKISVQELKNIAKKYTGNKNNLQIEQIVDPTKTDKGLTFLNKSPDGEFQTLKQLEVKRDVPIDERDQYYDEEIARIVRSFEDKSVVYSREIAPGQTMDYYVLPTTKGDAETGKIFGYRLEPLGDGDNVNDALLKIEEYNPSLKNMYTITLPEETTKKGPMFLFRKKDGGKIDTDGLVSITDIYGDY